MQQTCYRPKLAFQRADLQGAEPALVDTTRVLELCGNISHSASGSASCELGRTRVVCTVFGPRPRKAQGKAEFEGRGAIDVEAAFFGSATVVDEKLNRELATFLEDALQSSVQLELFPKSVLDVMVHVLEDDGSAFACAAICASYALAKCGIEMFDLVSACSLYKTKSGEIFVDATKRQERDMASEICTMAMFANSGRVTAFKLESKAGTRLLPEGVNMFLAKGQAVCQQVDKQMRAQLVREEEEFVL